LLDAAYLGKGSRRQVPKKLKFLRLARRLWPLENHGLICPQPWLRSSPFPDSVIALNQPITLYFNQAMDRDSVEAALHFEPRISGRFDWSDEQTVTFSPDQTLAPGSHQQLTLDTSAQAANKQHLLRPVELNFQVAEPLRVVQTVPAAGALGC
jgi:hypothetical protein